MIAIEMVVGIRGFKTLVMRRREEEIPNECACVSQAVGGRIMGRTCVKNLSHYQAVEPGYILCNGGPSWVLRMLEVIM